MQRFMKGLRVMMSDELYNRICQLVWLEEKRRVDTVVNLQNMIIKTRTTDPNAYLKLAQAQAVANYFDYFSGALLDWLGHFV